jgi:hypothetical protein
VQLALQAHKAQLVQPALPDRKAQQVHKVQQE